MPGLLDPRETTKEDIIAYNNMFIEQFSTILEAMRLTGQDSMMVSRKFLEKIGEHLFDVKEVIK